MLSDAEVRAGIFKSLSLGLGPVVSSAEPEVALHEAIRLACAEARLVYGQEREEAISEAGREARARAGHILDGLLKEKERLGAEELAGLLSPASALLTVYSDGLRMSGTVDKVIFNGLVPEPIVVSASL